VTTPTDGQCLIFYYWRCIARDKVLQSTTVEAGELCVTVDEQGVQPLRVLHLGGDEVPKNAHKQSSVCRHFHTNVSLRLQFMQRAVDIAARLGIDTVQVRIDNNYNNKLLTPLAPFQHFQTESYQLYLP